MKNKQNVKSHPAGRAMSSCMFLASRTWWLWTWFTQKSTQAEKCGICCCMSNVHM